MQELIRAHIQKEDRHFCLNQVIKDYGLCGPLIILINTHRRVTTPSYQSWADINICTSGIK